MPTTSPASTPAVEQRVREPLDVAVQVGVGDLGLLALLPAPVEGDPVAVAGLDVAVEAVVGGVDPAVGEPLVERRLGVVEPGLRLREPVELGGELQPPGLGVARRLLVQRLVRDQGLLAELARGLEGLLVEQLRELGLERLGCPPSNRRLPPPSVLLRSVDRGGRGRRARDHPQSPTNRPTPSSRAPVPPRPPAAVAAAAGRARRARSAPRLRGRSRSARGAR